jgi:hypothetical protein
MVLTAWFLVWSLLSLAVGVGMFLSVLFGEVKGDAVSIFTLFGCFLTFMGYYGTLALWGALVHAFDCLVHGGVL